jgi:predicted metal-dependent HD superfamily phosphohydrolase
MYKPTPEEHPLDFREPPATLQFVRDVFRADFPGQSTDFLVALFERVQALFAGHYPGYQACDTKFHDLAHTCQATAATVRILDGQIKSGRPPKVTARGFELAVAAILLHDAGYIKQAGDNEGTGAKYTLVHVERSADFAAKFLPPLGVTPDELRLVRMAIQCTGVQVDTSRLDFRGDEERLLGYALGTGDMLGQMAAANYPEQLPALYREFVEAGMTAYASATDLMRQTRGFYTAHVRELLEDEWGNVYRVLPDHFGDGRNLYLEAIERNLDRIDRLVDQAERA